MSGLIPALVSFLASVIGSVCGIGGGVIIKPTLDAVGIFPVDTISFLSGCTVLAMSVISVVKNLYCTSGPQFSRQTASLLAAGAVIGGIGGKNLYHYVISILPDSQRVGTIQAAALLVVTTGTLMYNIFKQHITTLQITAKIICILIGCGLGIMSAFLGIGGGPVNLVILFYFFSMNIKQAAVYSLYIIMFSQIASLISTFIHQQTPDFSWHTLIFMTLCGFCGGMTGSRLNQKLPEHFVNRLFTGLMVVIILINGYNIFKYY